MINPPNLARARLYLDIDGVLISEESPFGTINHFGERHAPEAVRRLGETGMELVWLTTW